MDERMNEVDELPPLWQYHKNDDLEAFLMGIGKRDRIDKARKLLQDLGIIEIGRNPNKKYRFDATTFYLFHPEVVTDMLRNLEYASSENSSQSVRKTANHGAENGKAITKDSLTNDSTHIDTLFSADAETPEPEPIKPTKPEQAFKKKDAPPDTDWKRWVDAWFDFYKLKNEGIAPMFNGPQSAALKSLRKYLCEVSTKVEGKSVDDCGFLAWSYILDNWHRLDVWNQQQFDLTVVLKKINDLLNQLKNGTTANRNATANGNQSNGQPTGTSHQRNQALRDY